MPEAEPLRVDFDDAPTAEQVRALAASTAAAWVELRFETDELPADVIAAFVDAVDGWLAGGAVVRLTDAPQMLAHTLYKVGRLKHSSSLIVSMRPAEPYAG